MLVCLGSVVEPVVVVFELVVGSVVEARPFVVDPSVHHSLHHPLIIVTLRRNHSDQWVDLWMGKGSDCHQFPGDRRLGPMLSVWNV